MSYNRKPYIIIDNVSYEKYSDLKWKFNKNCEEFNEDELIDYYNKIIKNNNNLGNGKCLRIDCGVLELTDRMSEMLSQNKIIEHLQFYDIEFTSKYDTSKICSNLLKIFKTNKTIKKISIAKDYFARNSDKGYLILKTLIEILYINTSIKEIDFDDINFKNIKLDTNIKEIKLKKIKITGNLFDFNPEFIIDIIRLSKKLEYLELELYIKDIEYQISYLRQIYEIIKNNKTIKEIKYNIYRLEIYGYYPLKLLKNIDLGKYIVNHSRNKNKLLLQILSRNRYKDLILNISRDYKQKRIFIL